MVPLFALLGLVATVLCDDSLSYSQNSSLCDLYFATNIAEFVALDIMGGWNCTADNIPVTNVCGLWTGVYCGYLTGDDDAGDDEIQISNTTIYEINLPFFGLTGYIPSSIGLLSYLIVLNLESNSLSGQIPSSVGNLSRLEVMLIDNNKFSGSIPSELGLMSDMAEIDFSYNSLNGSIPSSLCDLMLIQIMLMGNNQFTGSLPSEVGLMASLVELDFSYNALNGSIPSSLGGISDLEVLVLNNNFISGAVPSSLCDLSYLTVDVLVTNVSCYAECFDVKAFHGVLLATAPVCNWIPSGQPSGEPSFSMPSGQPSSQPAGDPSYSPSGQPSSSPTIVVQAVPSSVPTNAPTDTPPPGTTFVSFNSSFMLKNVSASSFESDQYSRVACRNATAMSIPGVLLEQVVIVSYSLMSRRMSAGADGQFRHLVDYDSLYITFSVTVETQQFNLAAFDAYLLYVDLSSELNQSVISGAYTVALASAALTYGSESVRYAHASGPVTSELQSIVTIDTPHPDDDSGQQGVMSSTVMLISVITAALVVLCVAITVYYYYSRHYSAHRHNMSRLSTKELLDSDAIANDLSLGDAEMVGAMTYSPLDAGAV